MKYTWKKIIVPNIDLSITQTTLVPEAFFYSLLANFATWTAPQIKKDNIKRKPLGSRPVNKQPYAERLAEDRIPVLVYLHYGSIKFFIISSLMVN